jgi:hypothetical protein
VAADVSDAMDWDVFDVKGDHVGKVENLLVGPGERVVAVVVERDGFLGLPDRLKAVPWTDVKMGPRRVILGMTAAQLKGLPMWSVEQRGQFADATPYRNENNNNGNNNSNTSGSNNR